MSANVETMFYVREVPWHGLGIQLEDYPTSKEAITAAGLDWRVESRPIFDMFGQEIKGFRANTRDKDDQLLGIVTNKYQIVQNDEAFEFTDSLISDEVFYETAGSLKDGKTVWLLAKMPETQILDDEIDPYICFTNNHDGKGSIRVCMTPVRVVCNNTLNFALETAKRSWATRHMGNMVEKLAEAKRALGLAAEYMDALKEESEKLALEPFTRDQFLATIDAMMPIDYINDSKRKIQNIESMREALMTCYNAPDLNNFRTTKYGALMAVTDMVAHTTPNRMTKSCAENNWGKIMNGHPMVDEFYKRLAA